MINAAPVSVTELSNYIKRLLDGDDVLSSICVCGELSNYKMHSSGHHYFTLKDEGAVISAVMFSRDASRLRFRPDNGMRVILYGRVSSFPKSGQYQIYVTEMQPDGVGALYIAYEQMKEKLQKQGYFDPEHKKNLPKYPERIAVITSPTGAAVRDIVRVLSNRYPLCEIIVCPVKVQGEGSGSEVAHMIDYVNEKNIADIIITGRGGGSLEDLWAFNEEVVAKAIYDSRIPVISAVGHEPDVTISDFVADIRAATPSNAAEIAVRDSAQLRIQLGNVTNLMYQRLKGKLDIKRSILNNLATSQVMVSPYGYINECRMSLDILMQRMSGAHERTLAEKRRSFTAAAAALDALSPLKILSRGYGYASQGEKVITGVSTLKKGEKITLRMKDGSADCIIDNIEKIRGSKK